MTKPKPAKKKRELELVPPELVTPQIVEVFRCREILAELAAYAAESDQNFKKLKKSSKSPSYTQQCLHLLDHPEHITDPAMTDVVTKILRKYVADNPPRIPTSKETAFMVDFWMNDGKGMRLTLRAVS